MSHPSDPEKIEYDEIVYRVFQRTHGEIHEETINRVLTAYAEIKVFDAILDAKPRPDDLYDKDDDDG